MRQHFTRRQFIATAGIAATATILGQPIFDIGTAFAATGFVRRNVGAMNASHAVILGYRKAIKAMQALPPNDPRSWAYQAAIHGTVSTPAMTAWNTCQHGNYFFWSWHRMYLYWFERIVRKMSGDAKWALPYWDWSAPAQRQLPAMFRNPGTELYTVNRNPAMNNGTGSLPASHVNYSSAFALVNFTSASDSIEVTPHNVVHGDIGGLMGSVPTAAQDPIFYLHHCNMDRLWNLWLAQTGGRADPLTDATWKNTKYTFFDENGRRVEMTGCDVLRASQQLRYTYQGEPKQVKQDCAGKAKAAKMDFTRETLLQVPTPPIEVGSEPVSFLLNITELRDRFASIGKSKTQTVFLELDEVEAESEPGAVWEVYVGLPPSTEPDAKSPYYVGNIALFGTGIRSHTHQEFKPAHFAFPINRAIEASLSAKAANQESVQVTLVPSGVLINGKPTRPKVETPVRIGRVRLAVETQNTR